MTRSGIRPISYKKLELVQLVFDFDLICVNLQRLSYILRLFSLVATK